MIRFAAFLIVGVLAFAAPASADPAFQQWLAAQWPAAQALGVSRTTFDAATRGLEPDLSLPDLAIRGQAGKAAAAAGIRAGAVAISARGGVRAARRARQAARRAIPRHARPHRARDRRARQCGAGDLGARDRLRRLQAAARRHPHAGDAGLHRQAQGFLPQRIPARLEDAAGRRAARRPALVLGRRDGAHAIFAVGVLQIRGRFRRRRQDRHLAFGAGRARLGRQAAQGQRLARRRALGDRGASAGAGRLHHRRAEPGRADRRMGPARLCAGLRPQARRARACHRSFVAIAGRHIRPGVSHAEELLRAQGL